MSVLKAVVSLFFVAIVALFSLTFISHNPAQIAVDLLLFQLPPARVAIWLLVFFIAGCLLGCLAFFVLWLKERVARRRVEKRLQTTSQLITGDIR